MSPAEAPIRVVTWNIHGGVGADRRCDLDRSVAILQALRPDVAALQEVDGRVWARRKPRAFERLAEALGGHVAEARLTGEGDRAYGHLLWSRWPLAAVELRRLPGGRFEPRALIDAVAETPLGPLRVLAAHFGLLPNDRAAQALFLGRLCRNDARPTIALGDFNDWRVTGSVQRFVGAALPRLATAPTWPARRPIVAMDRIYASGGIAISNMRAVGEARNASDHLALLAELRF